MEYASSHHLRRRVERIALTLPVRIEAKENKENAWSEITRFQALSSCGAGFEIQHPVKTGQLLLLTAPVPQKLRCYDFTEQQYRVWGVVRYCHPSQQNSTNYQIGVAFVGKYPPLSYHDNPSNLYELTSYTKQGFSEIKESPVNSGQREDSTQKQTHENTRQNFPRYPIPLEVFIESLDENQRSLVSETTVSENVSVSGASVFASLNVQIDDVVRINFKAFRVVLMAKVRNRRIGTDGMPRLHLEFIDRQLPLEGIE